MLNYHRYKDLLQVEDYIKSHSEKIQAIVGKGYVQFGAAQCPSLDDYADGVDTMRFLEKL